MENLGRSVERFRVALVEGEPGGTWYMIHMDLLFDYY